MFTVSDLKQLVYCQRLVYYAYCLPGVRVAATPRMEMGRATGATTEELEHRRSLRTYGLREGQREFDVWLESNSLGLCGRLDMLIRAPSTSGDELIPVDYKDSNPLVARTGRRLCGTVRHNWAVQLTAYTLLLEETHGKPVRRGFIYYIPRRRACEVMFDEHLRQAVRDGLRLIAEIAEGERFPPPAAERRRCAACEYRRLCNDV